MASEDGRDGSGTKLGQAGAMLASALTEFLTRTLELSGRRAGSAIAQALSPGQELGTPASWIDGLLTNYRDLLGDMVTAVPLIAQRLSKEVQTGPGDRLLFVVHLTEEELEVLQDMRLQSRMVTTQETIAEIKDCAKHEGLTESELPRLLRSLHLYLDDEAIRDLPALLDRLKYAFRKEGKRALGQIREALQWLQDPRLEKHYALLTALTRALGERVVRKVLRKHWLDQYADALRRVPSHSRTYDEVLLPDSLSDWFKQWFEAAGIEISPRLSMLTNWRDALILDHQNDIAYDVRNPDQPKPDDRGLALARQTPTYDFKVYGPREGHRYTVEDDQQQDRKILLPVRVRDATQSSAIWSVNKRIVQGLLDTADAADERSGDERSGREKAPAADQRVQPALLMKAWDIGADRTPVALFVVHYKEGDLGEYLEIGLGCFAAPRGDPLAVGMFALAEIPVTTDLACNAGAIWGYPKVKRPIYMRYHDGFVQYALADDDREILMWLTFPRGGESSSPSIPLFSYTRKASASKSFAWHRTVVTRSGTSEMLRGGGSRVSIELTEAGRSSPLGKTLVLLEIVDANDGLLRAPLFNVWTGHMSAELGPPAYVTVREEIFPA